MPENRFFYGNIWQIMAIKNLLQYRYQLIIKLLAAYMAIWQFFYEKKHQSIIIKSQTRKRGCAMNSWRTLIQQT